MSHDAEVAARLDVLLAGQRLAVLATTGESGAYASLVAFAAVDERRRLLFATTRATRKYANLRAEPRVALLIDSRSAEDVDFHGAEAVTATGSVRELEGDERRAMAGVFLARHPLLSDFVGSPTCALLALEVETYYLVGRFQNVVAVHMDRGS